MRRNAQVRTLLYRLLRLLAVGVRPLFGSRRIVRNGRGGKEGTPTVAVYEMESIERDLGLGRMGLIFAALVSGSDYDAGIRNCGIDTAVELARAGWGERLADEIAR